MVTEKRCVKDQELMVRVPIRWGLIPDPDKKAEEGFEGAIYPGCLVPENAPEWGWRCPQCGAIDYDGFHPAVTDD